MYDSTVRRNALALLNQGLALQSVSRSTGINRSTLRAWRDNPASLEPSRADCPRCTGIPALPEPAADYAYLLGLYLGDGCISVGGDRSKGVWKLRIACADSWPGLIGECIRAMEAVRPDSKVITVQCPGCTEVASFSKHWPCLFPQHGPGLKHRRKIELADWQQTIVDRHPGDFVRGLFHSDGCRGVNRVHHVINGADRWYEYPRYHFTNKSTDILELCGAALDALGVEWRYSRSDNISVAKRGAVARLDEFVGPKY